MIYIDTVNGASFIGMPALRNYRYCVSIFSSRSSAGVQRMNGARFTIFQSSDLPASMPAGLDRYKHINISIQPLLLALRSTKTLRLIHFINFEQNYGKMKWI